MRSLLLCMMHWQSRLGWSPCQNILITPASLAKNPANGSNQLKLAMYLSLLLPVILWFSSLLRETTSSPVLVNASSKAILRVFQSWGSALLILASSAWAKAQSSLLGLIIYIRNREHFLNWFLKISLSLLRLAQVSNLCNKALLALLSLVNGSGAHPNRAPPFLVVWFVFPVVCTFADGPDIAA